jgi:hypothetical protein
MRTVSKKSPLLNDEALYFDSNSVCNETKIGKIEKRKINVNETNHTDMFNCF